MPETSTDRQAAPSPVFIELRNILIAGQTLRTWSFLVAVFGDLAPSEGEALSGRTLGAILQAIGIRPAALRVALHRLRKDDWIESDRVGRESIHRLAPKGLAETRKAIPIIYRAGPSAERTFLHIFGPDQEQIGYRVAPQIALSAAPLAADGVMNFTPAILPDWICAAVCPSDLEEAAADLAERLTRFSEAAPYDGLSLLEQATLRVLIVQSWRRIALRMPQLSDEAFPASWRGPECRRRLAELLDRIPRPQIPDLEASSRQEE